MNLIGSVVIWGAAGILWGMVLLLQAGTTYVINGNSFVIVKEWAWTLIGLSILLPAYLVSKLLAMMINMNEEKCVRYLQPFYQATKQVSSINEKNNV